MRRHDNCATSEIVTYGSRHKGRILWLTFAATLAFGLWVANTLVHAQGGGGNVLYACVNTKNGNSRFVAQGVACGNNDVLVTWNIQGPTGPVGPQGRKERKGFREFKNRRARLRQTHFE